MKKIYFGLIMILILTFTACSSESTHTSDTSKTTTETDASASSTDTENQGDNEDVVYLDEDSDVNHLILTFDISGLEERIPGYEYMEDDIVYYSIDELLPTKYSEDSILEQTQMLSDSDITLENITVADEYSELLAYPSWLVVYTIGENEDTKECFDIYVQTEYANYRVHVAVPLDYSTDYHDAIFSRLSTLYWIYE